MFYYQIPVVPQGLTINPVQAVIEVNKTQRLIAAIAPSNTNKDNTITWESSDPSIATVNENGIVTGKKSGSVTITAKTGTNNDVTATAQVTVTNNVTITFDANGGSGSVPENIIANVDDYVNLPNKPENLTRENYKFIGWCTGTDASGVYDGENGTIQGKYPVYPEGSQIIMPENGCTLYAAWVQINGYADGTIVAAIIHAGSTIPAEPGCFNKTDTFDYTMVNGFNKVNVNVLDYFNPAVTVVGVDSVDKALTQKAKQELEEAVKKQSNLSYNPDTQYLAWHVIKDQQNDHKWHIDGTIQNKNTVKLEYDPNGATTGAIPGGVTAYKGNKVPVSDNVNGLARPGFNFIGWNTNADGSGTAYAVNSEITLNENVTLYAQWQAKNAVTIKYEATNGGAVSNGQDLLNPDTGTPQGSTPSAKPGYHFVNWTIKGTDTVITAGVDEETNQLVPTREEGAAWENITYVANFAPDTNTKYTVEYYLQNLNDNGYTKDETATVNATGTTDTEATAEEKSFDGFTINRAAEGTVATDTIKGDGSTVLKLYYDRNSYEVSYQYAEGTPTGASVLPEKQTVKFGAEVTVAPEATLAGYTFNGWAAPDEVTVNDGKFTMGSSNVVLTGSFTANTNTKYTVEYYLQNLNDNGYTKDETATVNATGTTDTEATAEE
ncbi:MAG: InlB B-repeat-containing protein, partial [Eggerthellaceae bacterium]|nr:InlB B-repeat-containing protein [Eggerthellaceae bacterium]